MGSVPSCRFCFWISNSCLTLQHHDDEEEDSEDDDDNEEEEEEDRSVHEDEDGGIIKIMVSIMMKNMFVFFAPVKDRHRHPPSLRDHH